VDLESTAAELYGLAPGDFVAARTAAEKQARAEGDRELAGKIRALGKPTAAAWVANQLVRRHTDEIAALRELGAGLREATATLEGEQLRQLSQQQNRVIAALVAQGRTLAKGAGQPMSEATERGLEATLRAALADEQRADQLAAGQLQAALEHVGFSGSLAPDAVPKPAAPAPKRDDLAAKRRKREQLEQARATVSQARTAEREAITALRDAEAAVKEAAALLAKAERDRDRAQDARQDAAERLQAATDELEQLND
jgi:DNA repair exonuclease SbcCD ATPase subunit